MIFKSVYDLVGNTPLYELCSFNSAHKLKARIFAKLECFNPTGSVKDRAAKAMIEQAEASGLLKEGATIIEPTSGNTGIALAAIGAAKGYKVVLTMPESMSAERRALLKAYGAELVLTEAEKGMKGAVEKAEELAASRGGVILGQFTNPANTAAHFSATGPEIWEDTDGKVDIFIAGVGTGGTLTGAGAFLKGKNPDLKIIAVEPADSPVLSKGVAGPHAIQGIGAGFVPQILDKDLFDGVIAVESADASKAAKELVRTEGILAGYSSGAALWAAVQLAALEENAGKNIVVIFPDGGEKYLSTKLYQ
ncbi:MAG: cysteine synthase A [Clostridia bacterium]|nr:cysteine synthase A [Clostridia bacterium]